MKKQELREANEAWKEALWDEKIWHGKTRADLSLVNEQLETALRKHRLFCERVAQRISSASSTADDIYSDLDAFLVAQDDVIGEARNCNQNYEELEAEYDSFIERVAQCIESSSRDGAEVLAVLEKFMANARNGVWTWSKDYLALTCDYINRLGERCYRSSALKPSETEEEAKTRIMAVDLTYVPDHDVDDEDGPESE